MGKLDIVLKRSLAGRRGEHGRILRALGLRKIGERVTRNNTPTIRGMIRKVIHMVDVEELGEDHGEKEPSR